jgi:hypothetical protein
MTPDIADALISGDGRLTRVFPTMGRAFLRRPFALMGIGAISFLPIFLYLVTPNVVSDTLDRWEGQLGVTAATLLPSLKAIFLFSLLSFCFAWSSGPLCWISYRAIYPARKIIPFAKSFRALLPLFGLWLLIFFVIMAWVIGADLMNKIINDTTEFMPYIWLGLLLALLAACPAYLSLCAPVFTLEDGSLRTRWQRMMALSKGFRWRSVGYTMACAAIAFLLTASLSTAAVAALPFDIRYVLDDWIYLATFGLFWMALCLMATSLYARIRLAHGELDPEDVANVFE